MNFLYNGGGRSSGGDHAPIQLPGSRVKLQPRRLRTSAANANNIEQEQDRGQLRTHLFMDLTGNGITDTASSSRRSPGLLQRLTSFGSKKDTWRKSRVEEMQEATAVRRPSEVTPEPMRKDLGSLEHLNQDCFIVPCHLVDRFLPTGHKLPSSTPVGPEQQRLNVRQRPDAGLGVVIHLLGHLKPRRGSSLDPQPASPLRVLLTACNDLLHRVQQLGVTRDAILLSNLERSENYPFLLYYTMEKRPECDQNPLSCIIQRVQDTFLPLQTSYSGQHTIKLYEEVATIARPPLSDKRMPISDSTGYIVSIFRVMKGDDRKSFERDWLSWTGARLLYRSIPSSAGLRRMILHKSRLCDDFVYYVLCCEYTHMLDCVIDTVRGLPALRGRLVGHTAIYKPMLVS